MFIPKYHVSFTRTIRANLQVFLSKGMLLLFFFLFLFVNLGNYCSKKIRRGIKNVKLCNATTSSQVSNTSVESVFVPIETFSRLIFCIKIYFQNLENEVKKEHFLFFLNKRQLFLRCISKSELKMNYYEIAVSDPEFQSIEFFQ